MSQDHIHQGYRSVVSYKNMPTISVQARRKPPDCALPPLPNFRMYLKVLHGIWSVIVATSPAEPSISVADFPGMDSPPYQCETEIDSRALCYDPRGWWNNAPVLAKGIPTGSGRLYRPSRGLSSSGLPWGAGSLNAPLEIDSGQVMSSYIKLCESYVNLCRPFSVGLVDVLYGT